ncbi:hypothetical protein GA0115253_1018810 [Streptomyces sp. Termitarium-T10T-6]|nr:hypothetical protein [Streptomyces sp. Termitarium-T10T-6]SCD80575.1 hypothetical protein GA0115253_1018810 [Streptomyces sp. Termitarium-T10T-6]
MHLYDLRICASLLLVLLAVLLGIVAFLVVRPGWEQLTAIWPFLFPFVLPLIGLLVVLSKRSHLRYVRVRQA